MRIIGDVHGKIEQYLKKIDGEVSTFQLGDMGLGFKGVYLPHLDPRHRFIRGNHDSPDDCRMHPNYAGEFGYDKEYNMFFAGGAYSIDYMWRTPGISWWDQEQMSSEQFKKAEELYLQTKPEIVVTHEIPYTVSHKLLTHFASGFRPEKLVHSVTGQAFQSMFEKHQPKVWLFGHYHIDKQFDIEGTHFVCLNELSTYSI